MDLGLAGRVYLVTGGSAGLGLATAKALVADGARVVLGARDHGRLAAAVAELGPEQAEGVAADNADEGAAERLVGAAMGRFGRIDGALVSVGGPPPGTAMDTGDDAWRAAFESVFLGAVRLARTVASAPGVGAGAAILFVLSTSVRAPLGGLAVSNGLRPGLAMVAKTLADELGGRGIRVNGILPGRFATARMAEIDAASSEEVRRAALAAIPLGRQGDPAEFGAVAAMLLSPRASYVTGTVVAVDGGSTRAL